MIKVNEGEVEVNGNLAEILADLTILLRALRESNITDEMIEDAVRLSRMTEAEVTEDILNMLMQKILEKLQKDEK